MDRFYIWEDEERHGPYSETQLERMLEDRIVTFSHECENARTGTTTTLDELFEIVPEEEDLPDEEEDLPDEGEIEDEEHEEEWEEDEEGWEEEEAAEDEWEEESDDGPPPNTVLFRGHPTLLRYSGLLLLAAMAAGFGIWLGPKSLWFFIAGFGLAVLLLIGVLIDRSTRIYLVTPRRVELIWGLIAQSSNEVRIEDIRTINVRKSGIGGLLGVGTVEFSSTGDKIDVAFNDLWAAQRVKALVREIQDELE